MESRKYGYCPHAGQIQIKCPKCGNTSFKSYPQAISMDAKYWTWEYVCTTCKQYIGIEVERD